MPDHHSISETGRRRAFDELLRPKWLPYVGLAVALWAIYAAYFFVSAPERVVVNCKGRGENLCRLVFGNLEQLLEGRATNFAYAAVFSLAALIVGLSSLRRLASSH